MHVNFRRTSLRTGSNRNKPRPSYYKRSAQWRSKDKNTFTSLSQLKAATAKSSK